MTTVRKLVLYKMITAITRSFQILGGRPAPAWLQRARAFAKEPKRY